MKSFVFGLKVFQIENGTRFESGESFIEFTGTSQSGIIGSSKGILGSYESDEFGDLWISTKEDPPEFVGLSELPHYAMDFLLKEVNWGSNIL